MPTPFNSDAALRIMLTIVDAAEKSDEPEPISVCVMGVDRVTMCSVRMDGAPASSVAIAEGKANTALLHDRNTIEFEDDWDAVDVACAQAAHPQFIAWGGGLLLHDEEERVVGAVAVSGLSRGIDDHNLAKYTAKNWQDLLKD